MPESGAYTATVEVAASPAHGTESPDLLKVSGPLVTLTWVTFAIMCVILYKVAWKPILKGLDQREQSIRKAMEDAEKARVELAAIEVRNRQMLAEAAAKGREMIEEARGAATQAAEGIQQRAREESQAILENARREIEASVAKARASLRAESAELAVQLAEKVLGEALDPVRGRALVEKLSRGMTT